MLGHVIVSNYASKFAHPELFQYGIVLTKCWIAILCFLSRMLQVLLATSTVLGGNKRRWTARTAQPVDVFEPSLHTDGCSWGWRWRSLNLRQNLHPGVRGVMLEKMVCRFWGDWGRYGDRFSEVHGSFENLLPSDLANWNSIIIFLWKPTIVVWMPVL